MEPKEALEKTRELFRELGPLLQELSFSAGHAAERHEDHLHTSEAYHASKFEVEAIMQRVKQARDLSLKAWRKAASLHKFIEENEDDLARAVVESQKKGNNHHPTEANGMDLANPHEGLTCGGDLCITEEGVKVLSSCCNHVVGEEQCRILFLRFKNGEISPEKYLAEVERLAGPVTDRDEKLQQIREILNPPYPGPDEEEGEPDKRPDDSDDEDPERVHEDGDCEPCNYAAAVQQLAPIGQRFIPEQNEKWFNDVLEEKLTVWRYSDLLMQEAVKQSRGEEIDIIEGIQEILRELGADKKK